MRREAHQQCVGTQANGALVVVIRGTLAVGHLTYYSWLYLQTPCKLVNMHTA